LEVLLMPGDLDTVSFTLRLPKKLVDALDAEVKERRTFEDLSFNRSRLIRELLVKGLPKRNAGES
jgi:metal-responsive CopG/Arc/MetJ family transcriptional regulator